MQAPAGLPSVLVFGEEIVSSPSTPRGESPRASDSSGNSVGQLLTIKAVHKFCSSPSFLEPQGCVSYETFNKISGQGFAPWEVHRPQQAVRQLLTDGVFKGAVLDCGCGIGDNSLFIAKYTTCTVDAVDMLPRCIAFAEMKTGLRNMRGRVGWHAFDLLEWDSSPLAGRSGSYDVALDSCLLHSFDAPGKERYLSAVRTALKPGGCVYVLVLSDQERGPGGPARVTRQELEGELFTAANGWELLFVRPHIIELHPMFWGGKGKAYLVGARKL